MLLAISICKLEKTRSLENHMHKEAQDIEKQRDVKNEVWKQCWGKKKIFEKEEKKTQDEKRDWERERTGRKGNFEESKKQTEGKKKLTTPGIRQWSPT